MSDDDDYPFDPPITPCLGMGVVADMFWRMPGALVGYGEGRLVSARDVVAAVTDRLRTDETVFLHAPGVDTQCDEARASIGL